MQLLFSGDELVLEYPTIYGISTPLRHLRLGIAIAKHTDFKVEYHKNVASYDNQSTHAAFLITHLDDGLQYLLVRNKGSKSLFYKKYKTIDYLVCSMDEEIDSEVIEKIKTIRGISICFALENPGQKEILNFTQLL
jgi:hypothetical protein